MDMFKEAFEKIESPQTDNILKDVNPLLEGINFDPKITTILAMSLPFYKGYKVLHIADHSVVPANERYVLYAPHKSVVLNFKNDVIYGINQEAPLDLNEDTVEDYVRFFFNYVRGKHGRFVIVENVNDIEWKDEPNPTARRTINDLIRPVTLLDAYDDGSYHLEACMVFRDSLFRTNIDVSPEGIVNLTNEELLVENLPMIDIILGH